MATMIDSTTISCRHVGGVVDDDVHAVDRRQCRDRQGDHRDHREPFRRDGHLGLGPGAVELDHALQVLLLAVGQAADPVELVDHVGDQRQSPPPERPGRGRRSGRTTSAPSAPIVRTASRPCRAWNSSSRNSSGLPMWPLVTRCSSCQTSLGQLLDERLQAAGQGGDDRVRQLERRPGQQLPATRAGASPRRFRARGRRVDRRVDRPVHGHHVLLADDLVQLEVVDVTAVAQLGRVQHDKHMITVRVYARGPGCVRRSRGRRAGGSSNTSDSTRGPSGSPHGMSTQTNPSSRASSSFRSSTGCGSAPTASMYRTSIVFSSRRRSVLGHSVYRHPSSVVADADGAQGRFIQRQRPPTPPPARCAPRPRRRSRTGAWCRSGPGTGAATPPAPRRRRWPRAGRPGRSTG